MNKPLFLLLLLFPIFSFSQTKFTNGKESVKIPFELINDVILINVKCNDIPLKMIFDTGSNSNILFSSPVEEIEFRNTRKISLIGLGIGEEIAAHLSTNNKLELDGLEDKNFEILIITNQNIQVVNKFGVEINGVIGTTFFKNYIIEINYDYKYLTLYTNTNKKVRRKLKKYNIENIDLEANKPFLKTKTILDKNKTFNSKLLIDTGLGDTVWLFENDSVACPSVFLDDFLGRGLSGDIQGKRARVKKLGLNKYVFHDALVSFPDLKTLSYLNIKKDRNGSIGGSFLKRFNWILDFDNKKAYLKKNSMFDLPFNYNMSGLEIEHKGSEWVLEKKKVETDYSSKEINDLYFDNTNASFTYKYLLKPIYKVFSVRADSPASRLGILADDVLLSINGKKTNSMSMQDLTNIFKSKEGREIKIEISRNSQILLFVITLEKQI